MILDLILSAAPVSFENHNPNQYCASEQRIQRNFINLLECLFETFLSFYKVLLNFIPIDNIAGYFM